MPTWGKDFHFDGAPIFDGHGVTLDGVRWTSAVQQGSVAHVDLYLAAGFINPLDPHACEAVVSAGDFGQTVHVYAISLPGNELLTERTYCVAQNHLNGANIKPLDVPLPDGTGEYEVRIYFQLGSGEDANKPLFPDQTYESQFVSEILLPVTVTESAAGDCSAGDCPEGMECVEGECTSIDGPGNGGPEEGNGGGDLPVMTLAVAGAGAFYLARRNKGGK